MKKNIRNLLVLSAVAILTSCGTTTSEVLSSATNLDEVTSIDETSSETTSIYTGKTNDDFEKAKTTYIDDDGYEQNLNMNTIYNNAGAPHNVNVQVEGEETHVFVCPFGFQDTQYDYLETQANLERIDKAFFGTDEEMEALEGSPSVQSFYNQSSYGLNPFQGEMIPTWVEFEGTTAEYEDACGGSAGSYGSKYAWSWYTTEYAKTDHGALADLTNLDGTDYVPKAPSYYDGNGDGYVDLMWCVYSKPYESGGLGNWWAYVTYTGQSAGLHSAPTVQTLAWASLSFMDEGFNGYDTHTYTHETGHTFGLEDYYDYNSMWSCMGGVDYMDHNIGDHNSFSKFSFGWVKPLVVDESSIITLNSFTDTGDCFLLPSPNYNGTAFDEYFLVELDGPTGLCETDYTNGYNGTTGFKTPGVRVLHVDARVTRGNHDTYLADNPENGNSFRIGNSKAGRSGIKSDGDYYLKDDDTKGYMSLLSMIESHVDEEENCTTSSTYNATSESLFTEGARLNFGSRYAWASTYMPSGTNMWNKAQSTTGWTDSETKTVETDEDMTIDFSLKVLSVTGDSDNGYQAQVQVTYED
jgi:M6 family metalloprotease-like protein